MLSPHLSFGGFPLFRCFFRVPCDSIVSGFYAHAYHSIWGGGRYVGASRAVPVAVSEGSPSVVGPSRCTFCGRVGCILRVSSLAFLFFSLLFSMGSTFALQITHTLVGVGGSSR